MPRVNEQMTSRKLGGTNYNYSFTDVGDLGASEYTLVTVAVDSSGSIDSFRSEMEKCIQSIIRACNASPKADNLLVRVVTFSDTVDELHGYLPLSNISEHIYTRCLTRSGNTALNDAFRNALDSTYDYGKELVDNDYTANSIVIVVTDGLENRSHSQLRDVQNSLHRLENNNGQSVESVKTILVGVNLTGWGVKSGLDDYQNQLGIDQFVPLEDATDSTLARLADFVSRSISSQSQKIGTGTKSESLKF